jgi:integrase
MRGNITKRGKSSWRIKFDACRDADGKRHTRYVTVKGTRKEAEAKRASLLNDVNRGVLVEPSKVTVAQHMGNWLDDKQGLSPLTRQRYDEAITTYIDPILGGIELQKLRPIDVKQWLVAMRQGRRGPRSARTILGAYALLRAALQSALRLDLVARNVADNVEPPKREGHEVEILKAGDVPTVLDALKGSRIYPIVALALSTGARRSELLALRWCDVDLERGGLRIEHSLEQTKAGLRFKAPKTKAGRRPILLPPFAVDVLSQHRKEQLELRLQLGMGKPDSEALVFCNVDGTPISPNYFSLVWRRAVERMGLPKVSFHSLRHSHASALIRAGLDVVRVSRQLGHSKPTITLSIYAHEFEQADASAADAIAKVLG